MGTASPGASNKPTLLHDERRAVSAFAAQIKGSSFKRMGNAGHFPMAEDPTRFLSYVQPILEKIAVEETAAVAASARSRL